MNALINAAAQALYTSPNAIASVEEWAHVYFVRFNVGRPTFVSKGAVKALLPLSFKLYRNRGQRKPWMARLIGKCATYRFSREWLEPVDPQWDKKGMSSACYVVDTPGVYHDCDDDYLLVTRAANGALCSEIICRERAEYLLDHASVLIAIA